MMIELSKQEKNLYDVLVTPAVTATKDTPRLDKVIKMGRREPPDASPRPVDPFSDTASRGAWFFRIVQNLLDDLVQS